MIRWPSSRSRTARSRPAAARSAACESAASGIPTSSIPEPESPSSELRARRSSPRGAIDADALAKACCVLEPEQSLRLIHSLPETECLIVMANRGTHQEQRLGAPGTHQIWWLLPRPMTPSPKRSRATDPAKEKDAKKAKAKTNPAGPWNKELELLINFEINNPGDAGADEDEEGGRGKRGRGRGRYRRPYVAVWVEDADGYPVRTLSLWVSSGGAGPFQWLPDLKRWFKADNDRKLKEKKEILFTVSRPDPAAGQVQGHLGRQGQ